MDAKEAPAQAAVATAANANKAQWILFRQFSECR
jgi:hypothetical protein